MLCLSLPEHLPKCLLEAHSNHYSTHIDIYLRLTQALNSWYWQLYQWTSDDLEIMLCFAMHMLLYYCNMTLYYNEKIVTHKTQHMKHVFTNSAKSQQWLSSAEYFFGLSKTNAKYSIIIWVMYYAPFSRLRNHYWWWEKAPLEPLQLYAARG